MGAFLVGLLAAVPLFQDPVAAAPRRPDGGLWLVGPAAEGFRGLGLGDGGVAAAGGGGGTLQPDARGACTTPGGILVECRREGVRLVFPSGCELLCAPDGFLHLRDGGAAGPFPGGFELLLGDGSAVCVRLGSSRRVPITSVRVTAGGRALELWDRREPVAEPVRAQRWVGERLLCLGDGGALYRPLALGPLLTLERVLVPEAAAAHLPPVRLALHTAPVRASIEAMAGDRSIRESRAWTRLAAVLEHADRVWDERFPPPRIASSPLRFRLPGELDLEFVQGGAELSMRLRRPGEPAFAEWVLGYGARARCLLEDGRWIGRAVAVAGAGDLAAREPRNELARAFGVLRALAGGRR